MIAYIYNADVWCEACAKEIMRELIKDDPEVKNCEDSDGFPQYAYDDRIDEAAADYPEHCAAYYECLNAETLEDGSLVGCLMGSLTRDGEQYVLDTHEERPSQVTRLWLERFDLEENFTPGGLRVIARNDNEEQITFAYYGHTFVVSNTADASAERDQFTATIDGEDLGIAFFGPQVTPYDYLGSAADVTVSLYNQLQEAEANA